jgi:hypothetical protein
MNSKEKLIAHITSEGRICPEPKSWIVLSKIIGVNKPSTPLTPLILDGWHYSSNMEKKLRFLDQVEYAFSLSAKQIKAFTNAVYALQDNDWHKI